MSDRYMQPDWTDGFAGRQSTLKVDEIFDSFFRQKRILEQKKENSQRIFSVKKKVRIKNRTNPLIVEYPFFFKKKENKNRKILLIN